MFNNIIRQNKVFSNTKRISLLKDENDETNNTNNDISFRDYNLGFNSLNSFLEEDREILKNPDIFFERSPYEKFWLQLINENNDPYYIECLKSKYKYSRILSCSLVSILIIVSQIEYEFNYYPNFYQNSYEKNVGNVFRIILSLIVLALCTSNWISFYNLYQLQNEERRINLSKFKMISDTFIQSHLFRVCLLFTIIDIIHPIPYFEFEFTTTQLGKELKYQVQTFLYSLMFLKLYHFIYIVPLVWNFSEVKTNEKNNYFGHPQLSFTVKYLLKEYPFRFLFLVLVTMIVVLGILLRRFEIINPESKEIYQSLSNAMWTIVCAMFSVGYGEFYPRTHLGRLISFFPIFASFLLISFLIVSLKSMSSFRTEKENKSYMILKRINLKARLKEIYVEVIKAYLQLYILRKRKNEKKRLNFLNTTRHALLRKLNSLSEKKNYLKRQIKNDDIYSYDQLLLSVSQVIKLDMYYIRNHVKKLENYKMFLYDQMKSSKALLNNIEISTLITSTKLKPKIKEIIKKNLARGSIDSCYDIINNKNSSINYNLVYDESVIKQMIDKLIFEGDKSLKQNLKKLLQRKNVLKIEEDNNIFHHISHRNINSLIVKKEFRYLDNSKQIFNGDVFNMIKQLKSLFENGLKKNFFDKNENENMDTQKNDYTYLETDNSRKLKFIPLKFNKKQNIRNRYSNASDFSEDDAYSTSRNLINKNDQIQTCENNCNYEECYDITDEEKIDTPIN